MSNDKRDAERIHVTGQLAGEVMVYQPMTILDLSDQGAQIETAFPLQLDSLHEFRLSLGDRSVVVKGRIVHCQIGDLSEGTVLYRTGLEFVETSEHAAAAIRTFVGAHRGSRTVRTIVDAEVTEEGI